MLKSKDVTSFQHPLLILTHFSLSLHNFNKFCERDHGVSLVQWSALKCLIDLPGTSAHELANAAGIHRSTLTPTLKRLEKKNFIYIDKNHQDARRKIISITRLGKEKLDEIERIFSEELIAQAGIECELNTLESLSQKLSQTARKLILNRSTLLSRRLNPLLSDMNES